ncbi:ATP-binding cassette domain-containing protein [Rhodovulum sp. 12E13]|uniref:ABC transporter ATP-binding protein n=1 Tax=Rhodovulum sp. 12E13 TaxID=2203891 RepID=UPI000E151E9B|nr:ATP-binding cassette domain-containing protein [Rhodovulum sp. 12E13]
MTSITLTGLRKSFGSTEVLKGVDLQIGAGEFTVILGPSGCGKSTLLRVVAGLEDATAGRIRFGERDVLGLEPRDRGCAMVFQNYALYPHMSVAENIAYALRVDHAPRAERRRRAAEIARLVQLDGLLDRKPAELSGGQRQRVAMARAIIRAPRVFLFDEPLSNLDAELRVQMRHEVRRIHEEVGATSIFVTHDQVEAMTLADRLVVMRGGEIQQVGAPAEVYERPQTLYVGKFIGSPSMGTIPGTYLSHPG